MMASHAARIALVCFIADPFDPPGFDRFGGGHLFIFDLGRYLVRNGFHVTFVTRLNSPQKPLFDVLGPRCSIYRLAVGPAMEIDPSSVGELVGELATSFEQTIEKSGLEFDAIHSHYWIAGEVARRFCKSRHIRHIHSVLSLGRLKPGFRSQPIRDSCEVNVFRSADILLTVCNSELSDLERLYPEVSLTKTHTIPYGVDPDVFYIRPQSESDFVRRQTSRFKKRVDRSL